MIISSLDIEEYHRSSAISNSKLNALREKGPAYFHGRYVAKTIPHKETDALRFGRQIDVLVTEGIEAFAKKYAIQPATYVATKGKDSGMEKPWSNRAGVCQEWNEAVEMSGREIVSTEDLSRLHRMRAALLDHPVAAVLIASSTASQATFRIKSEKYGLELQVRPDFASPNSCAFSDGLSWSANLKSTADFSDWFDDTDPESRRAGSPVYNFGYHFQAALDQFVLYQHPEYRQSAHFLIVVEKDEPFRVGVIRLDEEYLEIGFQQVEIDLIRLKRCYDANVWPKSPHTIITLKPPSWLLEKAARKAVAAAETA